MAGNRAPSCVPILTSPSVQLVSSSQISDTPTAAGTTAELLPTTTLNTPPTFLPNDSPLALKVENCSLDREEIVHMVSYLVRSEFRQLAELIIEIHELGDQLLSYERGFSDLTIDWIRKQQKAVMESTNMIPSDFEAIYIAAGLSEELKNLMST